MSESIRITDLAHPQLSELQQSVLAYGKTLDVSLDVESILDEARAAVSLDDFGSMDFRERLALLCDEWGSDCRLNNLARLNLRNKLVLFARNRLLIHDLLQRHPEIHDVQIREPIIVAGLPRSGTTHLLNLMAADSRLRSLPLWESYEPVPVPGEELLEDGTDPRYQRCADAWEASQQTVSATSSGWSGFLLSALPRTEIRIGIAIIAMRMSPIIAAMTILKEDLLLR